LSGEFWAGQHPFHRPSGLAEESWGIRNRQSEPKPLTSGGHHSPPGAAPAAPFTLKADTEVDPQAAADAADLAQ
jgi:hypothetical protein